MDPEERFERIERQLEFLAHHQAELLAIVERHSEQIEKHSEQLQIHSEHLRIQSEQIAAHSAQIEKLGQTIAQVGDLLLRTGRVFEEYSRRTDERLNALIAVVERYFSNGRH